MLTSTGPVVYDGGIYTQFTPQVLAPPAVVATAATITLAWVASPTPPYISSYPPQLEWRDGKSRVALLRRGFWFCLEGVLRLVASK